MQMTVLHLFSFASLLISPHLHVRSMSCPVEILHSAVTLSPLTLFTLLTSITTHLHVHPLIFRHGEHEFPLDFHPTLTVFTPEELRNVTKQASSFCNFQGGNREGRRAWLTACDPDRIEMIIHAPLASFTMDHPNGTFRLVSDDNQSCDVLWKSLKKRDAESSQNNTKFLKYYEKYAHLFSRKRVVEYAMFGDYTLYEMYGKDMQKTKERMITVLSLANSYYDSLNIDLQLVHLKIFDKPETANLDYTNNLTFIESFQSYLKKEYSNIHFDAVNILLEKTISNKAVGVAKLGTICNDEKKRDTWSWVSDRDRSAVDVSATFAHEFGHNLGMKHDYVEPDEPTILEECECAVEFCIMNGGKANRQYWSSCSLAYLEKTFKTGQDYCLWDEPGKTLESPTCGDGIVDKGEDCDCGTLGCITHNCCDNTTCKFRENAQCASGTCCDLTTCSATKSNRICRGAKTTCDLPEHCDGMHSDCPFDLHLADGEKCPDDSDAICFNGHCGSRKLQCKELWGVEATPAEETCYNNNLHENGCGWKTADSGMKCTEENKLCGRLQCSHPNSTGESSIRGFHYLWWKTAPPLCKYLLADYQDGYKPEYHIGMTPDGTSCGDGKFCLKTKCVSKSKLLRDSNTCDECESGVCTNLGCLCGGGEGGDLCLTLSQGSSPPFSPSGGQRALGAFYILLVFTLIWAVIFAVASIYYRVKRKENLPKIMLASIKSKFGKKDVEKQEGAKLSEPVEPPKV